MDEVLFRLTRYSGDPGAVPASSAYPATAVHYLESGALERVMSGPGGELTDTWRAGWTDGMPAADVEQTLTVVGDEAASFLELVAIPQASAAS